MKEVIRYPPVLIYVVVAKTYARLKEGVTKEMRHNAVDSLPPSVRLLAAAFGKARKRSSFFGKFFAVP